MRRFIFIILAIIFVAFSAPAQAAVTVGTLDKITDNLYVLSFTWTSAADGWASGSTSVAIYGLLIHAATSPGTGATAPTALYDIAVNDDMPVPTDAAMGDLANRSATLGERVEFYGSRPVSSILTIAVTNAGDSKTGSGRLYFWR